MPPHDAVNARYRLNRFKFRLGLRLLKASGFVDGYWQHWRHHFDEAQSLGMHVLPAHYYSPVPDTRRLPASLWAHRESVTGLDLNIDEALAALREMASLFRGEWAAYPREAPEGGRGYYLEHPAYHPGDGHVLHGMIRRLKPRRIVEIGSGGSTFVICEALRRNRLEDPDYVCAFTAIEPYPPPYLDPPPAELTELRRTGVEDVPLTAFEALEAGDVLFIDSTHVVRIGSDCVYEYLSILPRLKPGVVVHVHDIFLPFEYPERWIKGDCFFWNEQYLLHAFLLFNSAFRVEFPTYALTRTRSEEVSQLIPGFDPQRHLACSFWLRKVA